MGRGSCSDRLKGHQGLVKGTHIPILGLRLHANRLESSGVEPRRLRIKRVNEAVNSCIRGWIRIREWREWPLSRRHSEKLGTGEHCGVGTSKRVVPGKVMAQVSRRRAIPRRSVGIQLARNRVSSTLGSNHTVQSKHKLTR